MTDTTSMTKTIFLAASVEIVWQYLTQKEKLALWFHPTLGDLKQGGEYALLASDDPGAEKLCWGTVIEMTPPTSMVWSFTVQPLQGAMTTVTWSLESVAGGTRLTLVHEGVGDALGESALSLLFGLDPGWDEHFARLRTAAANDPMALVTDGAACD